MDYTIRYAMLTDVRGIGRLFDAYRQFYEQPADLTGATAYIELRLENNESNHPSGRNG